MTAEKIRSLLAGHRPGKDALDAQEAQALAEIEGDPGLHHWLDDQQRFHGAVRQTLREIPIPNGLMESILARRKIVPLPWWRHPSAWAAAAAVALLGTFLALETRPQREPESAIYRSRMVGTVLRQYSMEIVTNDMRQIQQFLKLHRAPADYQLPPALATLPPTGAGVLSWQGRPVSMVCLDGGKRGTLFLFITPSNAVAHDRQRPPFAQVSTLGTVMWEKGGKLYLLAGKGGEDLLRGYL